MTKKILIFYVLLIFLIWNDRATIIVFHDDNNALFLHGNLLAMVRILAKDLHQWLASRLLM